MNGLILSEMHSLSCHSDLVTFPHETALEVHLRSNAASEDFVMLQPCIRQRYPPPDRNLPGRTDWEGLTAVME